MSYNLSYAHFKRYKLFFAEIIKNWPQTTIIVPNGSANSLATHLRLCRKALLSPHCRSWPYDPTADWIKLYLNNIMFSDTLKPGVVIAGPKDAIRNLQTKVEPCTPLSTKPVLSITEPSVASINALFVLHHEGHLTQPTTIKTTADIPGMLQDSIYDVSHQAIDGGYNIY